MNQKNRQNVEAHFKNSEVQLKRSVSSLFEYLRFQTVSKLPGNGNHFDSASEWLRAHAKNAGFDVVIHPAPPGGFPTITGVQMVDPNLPTILFYGHYDVQPAGDLSLWGSNPFEPEIRDDRIYARGVGDNKGQHLCHIEACRIIRETTRGLPCNVKFIIEGEEEVGSKNLQSFLENNTALLACDLIVTADGPFHDSGRPSIVYGCRGIQSLNIEIRGPERDLHSGNFGGVSLNPAILLSQLISSIVDSKGDIQIEGFQNGIVSPTETELDLIRSLKVPSGNDAQQHALRLNSETLDYYQRLYFKPAFGVAGLEAGGVGEKGKNIIPSVAKARLEFRLVANQDPSTVQRCVQAHIERFFLRNMAELGLNSIDYKVEFLSGGFPARTSFDMPWTAALREAVRLGQGEEPLLIPCLGGSLPDYCFHSSLKKPVVTIPYANFDEANHSPNENMEVARFSAGIRTSIALLYSIGDVEAKHG